MKERKLYKKGKTLNLNICFIFPIIYFLEIALFLFKAQGRSAGSFWK